MNGAPRQVSIAVPVEVRPSTASSTYPFEAQIRCAGINHIALGETEEQAIRNARDWVVGARSGSEHVAWLRRLVEQAETGKPNAIA